MSVDANVAAIRRFFDAMSRGDIPALLDSYAEDARLQTMGNTLISGVFDKTAIAAAAGGVFEAFPEGIRFIIHGITASDDRVAIEAESFGRHASGKDYNNHYHFLARLRDGKIVEFKEYCDTEHVTDVLCNGIHPESAAA